MVGVGTMVIQLGSEEPVVSMHAGGKIVWARGNEIHTANLRQVDDHVLGTRQDYVSLCGMALPRYVG